MCYENNNPKVKIRYLKGLEAKMNTIQSCKFEFFDYRKKEILRNGTQDETKSIVIAIDIS